MRKHSITNINRDHLENYGDLYAQAFSGELWNNPWKTEDAIVHVKDLLDSPQSFGLEYKIDDEVVGYVLGESKVLHFGRIFDIDCLVVNPKYQKNGIGTALLDQLLRDLKEKDIKEVHLLTASEGILPEFYNRFGFKKEEDLILMGLEL